MTAATLEGARTPGPLWGRTFLHPALDYALIGGGLSLIATAVLYALPAASASVNSCSDHW